MKWFRFESGDFWGGTAAMLVALPSAIAFGVTVYAPLGSAHLAQGALAGVLGAVAFGLIPPVFGGTSRLISAPCAPAAAVLVAFALEFMKGGGDLALAMLSFSLLGFGAGLLQMLFGALGLGRLIAYMPYPVVSGYLSGVGLYIIAGQLPSLLGLPKDFHFWQAIASPSVWQWQGVLVGAVTVLVMLGAHRMTRRLPPAILGLGAGLLTYALLGLAEPALWRLEGNSLLVGSMGRNAGGFSSFMAGRWQALGRLDVELLHQIAVPTLTLAVLLSIDTLKTCVVLDALTRSRHESNRELLGQGLANAASAVLGGIPGAGTMGATLVNVASGGKTRLSGVAQGGMALVAVLLLDGLMAWVPVAALAAILIVTGARMIDRHSLVFLRQRSTVLDFVVIAAVVVTALTVSLIAASAVGVVLAVLLFVREQIGGTIVRRKVLGNATFSKRVRTDDEMAILVARGERAVVVELQGSLFFGTANQLFLALEPELKSRDFVILDMRRVQTVDVTAAHLLDQVRDMLADRNGFLIFSQLPRSLPSGRDMEQYFDQVGLVKPESPVRIFSELDDALEWVEDRILDAEQLVHGEEQLLELHEFEFFRKRKPETLAALEQRMEKRQCRAGEKIFARGDSGDELYIIRRGLVRIMLPISDRISHHLGTFGRGSFFGEMAFLDGDLRSADALAESDTELYVLSRKVFNEMAEEHKKLSLNLMEGLASALASRLRYTNAELRGLES